MDLFSNNEEQFLLNELNKGNKDVFSLLFEKYYKDLVLFAGNILQDKECCEDIVQNIFVKLWENRKTLMIETSLKSFLLTSVKNGCLDELRHRKTVKDHETYVSHSGWTDMNTEDYVLYSNLKSHLDEALIKLPEVCREAFAMNRFEGLKYKEISEKLGVSERTVEVRIGKAIGLLRIYLKDFLIVIFIIICFL
ncbi:MAG: RNA polymerase sigma-70 factor [Prevotella sp.]|jgi:RNA polymerase sigma-70 factor (ECF subfamily)|nr:RNA polymerase sigma-70 factor [uncultured Prevotella sp.]MCH3984780.1 RNA polymerase sigma-70 factor [Prevotella sp.]